LLSDQTKHIYEVRPRKDHRGFDLISDALPFGRCEITTPSVRVAAALDPAIPMCQLLGRSCLPASVCCTKALRLVHKDFFAVF